MGDGEVPEDRCGFVLDPEFIDEEAGDEYEANSDEWYKFSEAACCWRPTWDREDANRCIWHAESDDKSAEELASARINRAENLDGAYVPAVELGDSLEFDECRLWNGTFDGTDLRGASFEQIDAFSIHFADARLNDAKFQGAHLSGARFFESDASGAEFSESQLPFVEFSHGFLLGANFSDADLRSVRFSDTALLGTQFVGTDLRHAEFSVTSTGGDQFSNADLRGTSFDGVAMDLSIFDQNNVRFDGATIFGRSHFELPDGDWNRAARAYRSFQQTLRKQALPRKVQAYRIYEMNAHRKAAIRNREPITWAKLALARWTTNYGESPWRVAGTAIAVIIICAVAYPFVGGVVESPLSAESSHHAIEQVVSLEPEFPNWVNEIFISLYFSIVTFTTLGYGDLRPATAEAQMLATFESFVGALLMALLVYVLGRRATR